MKFVVVMTVGVLMSGLAVADTFTLPLPSLTGGFEADPFTPPDPGYPQLRSVDFTFPADVTAIDQLRLVLSGDWHVGVITCDMGDGPQVFPFLTDLTLHLTSAAFGNDYFRASVQPPDGPFDELSVTVESCCPQGALDLAALLGAEIHAELSVPWGIVGLCWVTEDSYGSLDDVRLEIDGTVGVGGETWSAVRSLYR